MVDYMIKPNITEGAWYLVEDGDFYLVNSENEEAIHDSFNKANAQAISAVPEMIDALIRSAEMIEGEFGHTPEWITQALKKAGCKIE